MKKVACFFLVEFICSVAVLVCGLIFNDYVVTIIGVALFFGGGFLWALAQVIYVFIQARKKADEMDRRKRGEQTQQGNATLPPQHDELAGAIAYSIHGYRHSPTKQKICTILFLTVPLGCCAAGLVLLSFGKRLAAYICFGCFMGIILLGILCVVIAMLIAKRRK